MILSELHNTLITNNKKQHTRVSILLKSITTSDQHFIAATTTIIANNTKRNDIELAAEFLLLAASHKQGDGN